jgi:hypothetical protein
MAPSSGESDGKDDLPPIPCQGGARLSGHEPALVTQTHPEPLETNGNSEADPAHESPCNHDQIMASISLTENRGVGSSILPLAIA